MKTLLLTSLLLMANLCFAQFSPLPTSSSTIALWNFDETEGSILDSAPNPLDGQGFSLVHESVPEVDPQFGNAYKFTLPSSFIDMGFVTNSKIDFTGSSHFMIEALIHLTASAPSTHVIADFENVKFEIINNQLAGLVRQPSGLVGVVSTTQIQPNVTYRVGFHFSPGVLILTINGNVSAKVLIDHPISAPLFSSSHAYIGGNIFGQNFPGFIDDVRVSSVTGVDFTEPNITLVQPQFQVKVPKPNFLFTLTDNESGVDPASIQIFLNGVRQNGLAITANEISGQMDDNLSSLILNEVKISFSDFSGNSLEKKFIFTYLSVLAMGEYETDSSTVALWHMNDFSMTETMDDSGNSHHGFSLPRTVTSGDGVFSKGRDFVSSRSALIQFDGVRFGQSFTFEGWYRPLSLPNEEVLFYNGQITVVRFGSGSIRVLFHTYNGTLQYITPSVLLPAGELHHLAIAWDGAAAGSNLKFFVDGALAYSVEAIRNCDFDETPKVGYMGERYNGMMDEIRVSSVARTSFNIPTVDNQIITFLTLKDGTSVSTAYPEFHAVMNSSNSIELDTLRVRLNGINQPIGTGLIVTETSIDGTMSDAVQEGLNILEVEFTDNAGNYRKKSQYFIKTTLQGLYEYEADSATAALWHFNSDTNLQDSSAAPSHMSGARIPDVGVFEKGQTGTNTSTASIDLSCRSFTVEGYFRKKSLEHAEVPMLRISGPSLDALIYQTFNTGSLRMTMGFNNVSFDQVVPGGSPMDLAFHHYALVYDSSRSFGQLMLFIDGQMKIIENFKSTCNATKNYSLTAWGDAYHVFDEIRVSRSARYAFNIQKPGTSRAVITNSSHLDGQSVNTETIDFSVTTEDTTGIDLSRSKLLVNGIQQSIETGNKTRFETVIQSQLSLVAGVNVIKLKLFNVSGNETIQIWNITRSAK